MKRNLEFRPEARIEFDDAADWYECQKPGLRSEFVFAVDAALFRIRENHFQFPVIHGTRIRRALVPRFPYAIFFDAEVTRIIVFAIFHTSRNPLIWRGRID